MQFLQYPPDKKIQNYQFSFKAKLGKGAYGTVYGGRNIVDNKIVALKIVDKKILLTDYASQLIASEIEIMKLIEDKNIVRLIDVLQSVNNTYIITEFCNGGDLREYLKKRKSIPENDAINVLKDLLHGIKALLKIGIIHRDIKPANIMIHDGVFKITDFGFAKQVDSHIDTIMNSLVGTPLYMSPQILKRQSYTSKCDIWSLGLIFYELIYGITPWHSQNLVELMGKLDTKPLEFPPFPKVSEQTIKIIKGCLQINEEKRISWDQLFSLVGMQEQTTTLPEINQALPVIQKNTYSQYQSQQQESTQIKQNLSFVEIRPHQRAKQRTESMGTYHFVSRHNRSMSNATPTNDADKSSERQKGKFYTKTKISYLQPDNRRVTPQRNITAYTQESERDRNNNSFVKFTTQRVELIKFLENAHTPPLPNKKYSTNNNDSYRTPSNLQSNSTNTSNKYVHEQENSSNVVKVNEFQIEEKSREPLNHIIANGYFNACSNLRLKRTFSNHFQDNALSPISQQKNSILQLLKIIQIQFDFIPNHIAIKKDIESLLNQHKITINNVREQLYTPQDIKDLKIIINCLVDYLNNNPQDNFVTQLSVMLLLLLNYNQIILFNVQTKSLQLSKSLIEQIKKNQKLQQQQLLLSPEILREQIKKLLK
ncbi:unnamed protein product (macronuclear) [Paramecium tetraurelia]|uniref:Protein kinase domain-containing protein n=1 Tax=Paramecium tetraurelia TaxID=5888 RepID=A0D911_PARTE|nr:uncharacterized protein GSPATT00014474001 [Paramecium tetraurelia]CAK79528.1 unnamed protein product [Paramecium tetraurelia]|eukprot:XP_001446925.1 hypothetical protein (macronuclear) [Paramecium tetraurelia strain d4-2]